MNKAFVKDSEAEEDELEALAPAVPAGAKYYITRSGFQILKEELDRLVRVERPEVVSVVSWAASNGDRSENGDYIYGKRRLREIDRRIRFLIKRLEAATVVDPCEQENLEQVFFGATVTVCDAEGEEATYQIVGVDEANASDGRISWVSPLAKALLKARLGDTVRFMSPSGLRELDIADIQYR
ncbi:MAG: transcription elongation factor GreB [Uliginosibacterium sp.]|jgi:transcription elongation factor GreB|nr:transcription elongation factor GreB [Uliginosibacterium sp.]MBK9394800.1 transcription elongation factor GreB [Uliginosibacterium sp.]MBK9614526.1 transcription elongation factor GreB [Uliginosibacterium sp.]